MFCWETLIKILPTSPTLEDASLSVTDDGTVKNVKISTNQPTDVLHFKCGEGYSQDCNAPGVDEVDRDYYIPPSSRIVIGSVKEIRNTMSPEELRNTRSQPPPTMEDLLYWEMGGSYLITGVNFKIKYSDGSQETFPLEKIDNLYFGKIRNICAALLPLQVPGGYRLLLDVRKSNLDLGKILPSYDYEVEIQTSTISTPPLTLTPLHPSATTEEVPQ